MGYVTKHGLCIAGRRMHVDPQDLAGVKFHGCSFIQIITRIIK